jgi:type III secretion system FlhB-like substrate exporter
MSAAAREALQRMLIFSWQDLSGVAVALAFGHCKCPDALNFASALVSLASEQCADLSTQAMLNIALSASRIGVPVEAMYPLVSEIRAYVPRMNHMDLRQWAEIQRRCTDVQG